MKKPESFEEQMKAQLDSSVESLPDSVKQQLKAARQKALAAAQSTNKGKASVTQLPVRPAWHKPMWAMAASICLMIPLWYGMQGTSPEMDSPLASQTSNLEALELMSALAELDDEEMELVDNLDFALWLIEQQESPAHG